MTFNFILLMSCAVVLGSMSTSSSSTTSTTSTHAPNDPAITSVPPSISKPETKTHENVFSIRTIDFSRKKQTTTPKPVNTCFSNDMCKSMPGICHKGTCMTKKCSSDIVCLCEPGFTGQFCDRNISEVQKKVNGKLVSTTPKANGKTHVNGHVDIKLINSQSDKSSTGPDSGPVKKAANEGGNVQNNTINVKENPSVTKDADNKGSKKRVNNELKTDTKEDLVKEFGAMEEQNKPTDVKLNMTTKSIINSDKSVPHVVQGLTEITTETMKNRKSISETKQINQKAVPKEIYADGSYRKGPESTVRSDNSPLPVQPSGQEIKTNAQSIIEQKSEIVKIPTVSVERNRVGIVPDTPRVRRKKTNKLNSKSNKVNSVTKEKKININIPLLIDGNKYKPLKMNPEAKVQRKKETSINKVPSVDSIGKAKDVLLSQSSGTVDITNDLVTGHALFENKEITITIEPSLPKGSMSKEIVHENSIKDGSTSGEMKSNKESTRNSNFKEFTVKKDNIQNMFLETTANTAAKDSKLKRQPDTSNAPNTKPNSVGNITVSDKTPQSDDAAQQHDTKRNNTTDINPLLQLLSIIGSREFVDQVSAVKIEIITKKNSTEKLITPKKGNTSVKKVKPNDSQNEATVLLATDKNTIVP